MKVYRTREWQMVRLQVLKRDGYRCRECGKPGRLEVHHRIRLQDGGAPYDPANLETLCRSPCHFDKHRAHMHKFPEGPRGSWKERLSKM